MKPIQVYLTADFHRTLKKVAAESGLSLSDYVRGMLGDAHTSTPAEQAHVEQVRGAPKESSPKRARPSARDNLEKSERETRLKRMGLT